MDGFTADQWAALQKQYKMPTAPAPCPRGLPGTCSVVNELGQALFFDPALSGNGQVACITCHDPKGWFVDTRTLDDVSMGATKWTAHNTISVVNLALKQRVTWTGQCKDRECGTAEDVITDIALPRAMASNATVVANAVRSQGNYVMLYNAAGFGMLAGQTDDVVFANVAKALASYSRQLVSLNAPFDSYIKGNASALSASARNGFTLFVGKAMCAECHSGGLFTDSKPHVTGVAQAGTNAPAMDPGVPVTGGFFTPPLRQIAQTGPYMHDGSLATLTDVIDFYRRGGDAAGYTGEKDPLMQPLDLTDDEAQDLEAFLRSLTGDPIGSDLTVDLHSMSSGMACTGTPCGAQCCTGGDVCTSSGCMAPSSPPMCPMPTTACGPLCVDTAIDPMNCGACGHSCATGSNCVGGTCVVAACPMPTTLCGAACVDTATDATNCGACGTTCATGSNCVGGTCVIVACPMPTTLCSAQCVDTATDPMNCGTCGNTCATGSNCVGGTCAIAACPMPTTLCGAQCVSTATDPMNCGGCGVVCPTNKPVCTGGVCGH